MDVLIHVPLRECSSHVLIITGMPTLRDPVAVKAFEPGSVIFQVKNSFPSINTVSFTFF